MDLKFKDLKKEMALWEEVQAVAEVSLKEWNNGLFLFIFFNKNLRSFDQFAPLRRPPDSSLSVWRPYCEAANSARLQICDSGVKITTSLKAHPALHNKSDRDWRKVTEDDAVMFIYREPVYTSVFIVLLLTEKYFPHLFSGARCVGEVHVCFFFQSLCLLYLKLWLSRLLIFYVRCIYYWPVCISWLCFFFGRLVGEKLDSCYLLFCIHYRFPNVSVVSRISLFLHAFVQFCSFM